MPCNQSPPTIGKFLKDSCDIWDACMDSTIFMTTKAVPFYYSTFWILMVVLCNSIAKAHAAMITQHNCPTYRYGIDTNQTTCMTK